MQEMTVGGVNICIFEALTYTNVHRPTQGKAAGNCTAWPVSNFFGKFEALVVLIK